MARGRRAPGPLCPRNILLFLVLPEASETVTGANSTAYTARVLASLNERATSCLLEPAMRWALPREGTASLSSSIALRRLPQLARMTGHFRLPIHARLKRAVGKRFDWNGMQPDAQLFRGNGFHLKTKHGDTEGNQASSTRMQCSCGVQASAHV